MNLQELAQPGPVVKTSLTWPNPANVVEAELKRAGLASLAGMPDVYITGSRVWRPVYGLPVDPASDIDIILEGDNTATAQLREHLVARLGLLRTGRSTRPSMNDDRDEATLPGLKYVTSDGLVVDVWGMAGVWEALKQYPAHSHASSRMAWSCEFGTLLILPNELAA